MKEPLNSEWIPDSKYQSMNESQYIYSFGIIVTCFEIHTGWTFDTCARWIKHIAKLFIITTLEINLSIIRTLYH